MDPNEYKDALPRLPISKCKRIAKTDPDYILTTKAAYIATAFATQLFVQSLSEEAVAMAHLESKKPASSKSIRLTYNYLSHAVARIDKFNFLCDVVPETKMLSDLVRTNKVRYSTPVPQGAASGQTILPFKRRIDVESNDDIEFNVADTRHSDDEHEIVSEEEQLEPTELEREMEEVAKMNLVEDLDDDDDDDESSDIERDGLREGSEQDDQDDE